MLLLDDPRLDDVEGEQARAFGIGDIDGLFVRRQADPVRGQQRIDQLDDLRPVRQGIIQPAIVAVMREPLAEIGEIEPALPVEHDVVRRRQFVAVALGVERLGLAGFEVDALDRAVLVVRRRPGGQKARRRLVDRAAIVADIERAVGSGRAPVRPAAGLADLGLRAVRRDAGHFLPGNFSEDDRAVGHPDRAFRKAEIGRDDADIIGHIPLQADPQSRRKPGPTFHITSADEWAPAFAGAAIIVFRTARVCPIGCYPFTWRMMPTHLSRSGRVLSAGSGGQPPTTRATPMSR